MPKNDPAISHFYVSWEWRRCRKEYLRSVAGLCENCLSVGLYVPAEEVHHIKSITADNVTDTNVTLNAANLIALCKDCHHAIHFQQNKRWRTDENGHVQL